MRTFFMRYPKGKTKAVTFSYDDGVVQDKRLAELFDAYGMKATFNLNCEGFRKFNFTKEEIHEYFLSKGHEVAVHGKTHRANGSIRTIEGISEVLECRLELEEKCGRIIRGMAYPNTGITVMGNFGTYETIRNYLAELDIAYARTLGGDNDSFNIPEDFYAWMPSAHHDNAKIFDYIDKFLSLDVKSWNNIWNRYPRLLYIWGHSYEFDKKNNWDRIEEICKRLANNDDIWYATNIEICEYVGAYKRLIFSADGYTVYNPTATTVWFDVDSAIYSIGPGETLRLAKE